MPVEQLSDTLVATTRAMASAITIKVSRGAPGVENLEGVTQRALAIFHEVEDSCTRFNATSPLMRANATPTRWHRVPPVLFTALQETYGAYQRTQGIFDPRVISSLVAMGYDSSMRFDSPDVRLGQRDDEIESAPRGVWKPRFRTHKNDVWLGEAVDLGGIGKGLAVRWASEVLAEHVSDYLVEAGGDCYLAGRAPDGGPWCVGVEDPFGDDTPVAVLAVSDRAVATSSTRLRHWRVGDKPVHHLIDPRTGRSGGEGLVAVTVVGTDAANAEVQAKTLFLAGRDAIGQACLDQATAALWCDVDGRMDFSAAMAPFVTWKRA